MFTFFLPTTAADRTYKSLEKERMKIVETEPELAVMMIIDYSYDHDPWLWDHEWKNPSKKAKKGRRMKQIY